MNEKRRRINKGEEDLIEDEKNSYSKEQLLIEVKMLPNEFDECLVPFVFFPNGINNDYETTQYLHPNDVKSEFISHIYNYVTLQSSKDFGEENLATTTTKDIEAKIFLERLELNEYDFPETLSVSFELLHYLFLHFFSSINDKLHWSTIPYIKAETEHFKKWLKTWEEFYDYMKIEEEEEEEEEDDDEENKPKRKNQEPLVYFTIVFNVTLNRPEMMSSFLFVDLEEDVNNNYLFYIYPNIEYEQTKDHIEHTMFTRSKKKIKDLKREVLENIEASNVGFDWKQKNRDKNFNKQLLKQKMVPSSSLPKRKEMTINHDNDDK